MNQIASMTEAEYRAIPAVNYSSLKEGRRSIAHMAWAMANPKPPSDSMRIGTAFHIGLLESKTWHDRVAISEKFDRRTKAGKDAADAFESENAGKLILEPEEAAEVKAMLVEAYRNDSARAYARTPGRSECVVQWVDRETGLACKARIDRYCEEGDGLLIDIKTTRDASVEGFTRDFYKLGYFMQAAWYIEGFREVTGKDLAYAIVAVENAGPYKVAVYSPSQNAIDCGRGACHHVLRQYAADLKAGAAETGRWSGYPNGVQELDLPRWAQEIPEVSGDDQ